MAFGFSLEGAGKRPRLFVVGGGGTTDCGDSQILVLKYARSCSWSGAFTTFEYNQWRILRRA